MRYIKTPKKIRRFFGMLILGLVLVFFILAFGGITGDALSFVQRPLLSAGTWLSNISGSLKSRSALIAENQDLKQKVAALSLFTAELESLRDENASLKLQLGYLTETGFKSVTSAVTARSISPNADTISINRGEKDGIVVGDPVIVDEGVLIGKISAVTSRSSTVRLLSDRASKTAATILNQDRTLGIVEGSGGTLLDFKFIPQNVEISIDDVIITSGLEENVPYGLVIGIINNVTSNDTDPFQEAVIESVVDYRRYTMVSVITGFEEL